MADNDYNTVRPIEGLPNVFGIAPTEQQQQERRNAQKDRQQRSQPASDEETQTETPKEKQTGNHLIDYRA
jgi:hypothetical protein